MEIDLAAKQMCLEATRAVLVPDLRHLPKDAVALLLKAGHCWCVDEDHAGTPHHACCKCGDRYAVEKEKD